MKKLISTLVLALIFIGCGGSRQDFLNPPIGTAPYQVTILHHNDANSALLHPGPGLEEFGGAARFSTLVSELREESSGAVLVVSAGDAFSASAEFDASLGQGVPFYDSLALDIIGFEASAVGNQEFDYGPEVFAQFLAGVSRLIPYLGANLNYDGEPDLAELEATGQLAKSTVLEKNGRSIGLVGLTTPRLPFISSPRNVTLSPDLAASVQQEIDRLSDQGVDIVLLLSHLETLQLNRDLLRALRGIDILIAATPNEILAKENTLLVPGDQALVVGDYPAQAEDASGKSVVMVSTAGRYKYVGRLVANFDSAGSLLSIAEDSGPVRVAGGTHIDAVSPDPLVQLLITEPLSEALALRAGIIVATSQVALDATEASLLSEETNAGNLVADAFLQQARALAPSFSVKEPDVALANGGGIAIDQILPPGKISALNISELLPFPSFLTVVEDIPAAQFKELLENAVSRVEDRDGRFAQVAGFQFTWDPSGTAQVVGEMGQILVAGTRVREVTLDDGTQIVSAGQVLPGAPALGIATIDFLARGGDQYPFRNADFTVLGITYQAALLNYLEGTLNEIVSSAQYPEGGEGRIVSL